MQLSTWVSSGQYFAFTEKNKYQQRGQLLCVLVFLFVGVVGSLVIAILYSHAFNKNLDQGERKPNVLFIVVDDLRPALGCYGDTKAITPNIDNLAKKSILFKNAFAQQSLCAPSRTSFLTSRRPDTLHLYETNSYWRTTVGNFTSLPQHFKNHGYQTISVGKIFHHGKVSNYTDDFPYSWSIPPFHPPTQDQKMKKVCPTFDGNLQMNLVCPVDVSKQPGKSLPDMENTAYAIDFLKKRSGGPNKDSPFFLGVGFYKPHIPFKFPKEYLDLYPIENMDLAPNNTRPAKMPDVAWNPWTDLRLRDDVKKLNVSFPYGPLPEDFQKLTRQGYYASLSYLDDRVGELLQALQDAEYAQNTLIILIGDHGWSLGEHQEWSKYSNFEVAVKVPLLVHIPGVTDDDDEISKKFTHISTLSYKSNKSESHETKVKYSTEDLVELVDLFPTLAEMVNIAIPSICKQNSTEVEFCSEGLSFVSVINNVVKHKSKFFEWKKAVFSQYPRPSKEPRNDSDVPSLQNITVMGYSIRNKEYRYTEWVEFDPENFIPSWGSIVDQELYIRYTDPLENNNVASNEEYSNIVIDLSKRLKKGWRSALPDEEFSSAKKLSGKVIVS